MEHYICRSSSSSDLKTILKLEQKQADPPPTSMTTMIKSMLDERSNKNKKYTIKKSKEKKNIFFDQHGDPRSRVNFSSIIWSRILKPSIHIGQKSIVTQQNLHANVKSKCHYISNYQKNMRNFNHNKSLIIYNHEKNNQTMEISMGKYDITHFPYIKKRTYESIKGNGTMHRSKVEKVSMRNINYREKIHVCNSFLISCLPLDNENKPVEKERFITSNTTQPSTPVVSRSSLFKSKRNKVKPLPLRVSLGKDDNEEKHSRKLNSYLNYPGDDCQNKVDILISKNLSQDTDEEDQFTCALYETMLRSNQENYTWQNEKHLPERLIKKPKVSLNNDNFVRLNLRNRNGSCCGSRNLRIHSRRNVQKIRNKGDVRENSDNKDIERFDFLCDKKSKSNDCTDISSSNSVMDPLHDFLDGKFHSITDSYLTPKCPRHQRSCKLLIVKKTVNGNRGKMFYTCSMPIGEKCKFFKWEEDCIESAQRALLKNSSTSGFIARQVLNFSKRFKNMTLFELRNEVKNRKLCTVGKKNALLTRLLVWVRDEICRSFPPGTLKEEVKSNSLVNPLNSDSYSSHAKIVQKLPSCSRKVSRKIFQNSDTKTFSSITSNKANNTSENCPIRSEFSFDFSDSECTKMSEELEICGKPYISTNFTDSSSSIFMKSCNDMFSQLQRYLIDFFGFSTFREGQEWAIQRCLQNKRSLLVAPTGMGKSLCYALPALVSEGLCVVVSPLVSLIQDQLHQLPPRIPSATLSGNMSATKLATIIDDVIRKRLKILFVSPERLVTGAFRRLLKSTYNVDTKRFDRKLPPVSLLCVDEAHCVSQWGHNFRPCYLRLSSLIPLLKPRSILALTATAGPEVVQDICKTLEIPLSIQYSKSSKDTQNQKFDISDEMLTEECGVNIYRYNRRNIDITVSFLPDEDLRIRMLITLLEDSREVNNYNQSDTNIKTTNRSNIGEEKLLPGSLCSGSIIIYVWRRKEAEIVSESIRASDVRGGVVYYHGNMDNRSRSHSQVKFMRGRARICVATVAFGMGINKVDVSAVVHLCLPPSPENYLQEIGRAGRNGRPSRAIALLLSNEIELKHSLAHSDKIVISQVDTFLKILNKVAMEALNGSKDSKFKRQYLDVALPISSTVKCTDIKEELIETLLSLLECDTSLGPRLLTIEGIIPDMATITLKRRSIEKLSEIEPVLRCINLCRKKYRDQGNLRKVDCMYDSAEMEYGFLAYSFGVIEFSVVKCAGLLGPNSEPRHVYAALRRLEEKGELELSLDLKQSKSIHLRLNEFGIKKLVLDISTLNDFISSTANDITEYFLKQDINRVAKVETLYSILTSVSSADADNPKFNSFTKCDRKCSCNHTNLLNIPNGGLMRRNFFQDLIQHYFEGSLQKSCSPLKIYGYSSNSHIPDIEVANPETYTQLSLDVSVLLQDSTLHNQDKHSQLMVHFGAREFQDYTALLITKILHGIDSSRCPVLLWCHHPLWGKWRRKHFMSLLKSVSLLVLI